MDLMEISRKKFSLASVKSRDLNLLELRFKFLRTEVYNMLTLIFTQLLLVITELMKYHFSAKMTGAKSDLISLFR